jgi:transcriptional regulator with GAF, ATPase, and Fis domain
MLSMDTFKEYIRKSSVQGEKPNPPGEALHPDWLRGVSLEDFPTLKQGQWMLIRMAMEHAGNNQSIAAQMLGITKQALSKRLKKKEK